MHCPSSFVCVLFDLDYRCVFSTSKCYKCSFVVLQYSLALAFILMEVEIILWKIYMIMDFIFYIIGFKG
jgi:hypothetical protein